MILVAGDLMVDVFLLPELREDGQHEGVLLRPGGSAANTASWLAEQGEAVSFLGRVGDDSAGHMLIEDLRRREIETLVREEAGRETGVVVVQVGSEGDRLMRSARGANMSLAPEDILEAPTGQLRWMHLTGYGLLSPHGIRLLEAAVELSRRNGVPLSFDPSSLGVVERYGAAILEMLTGVPGAVLLPNEEEALALTGRSEVMSAARALSRVARTAVKRGAAGAALAEGGVAGEVRGTSRRAINTTGAGDAFNAGVIHALSRGRDLSAACRQGNDLAARVLAVHGARP